MQRRMNYCYFTYVISVYKIIVSVNYKLKQTTCVVHYSNDK